MSVLVRRNILYNYIGHFYLALVSLLVFPLFLKYMGAEEYGLIGIFMLLSAWLNLLDFGLSPALGREIASLKEVSSRHAEITSIVSTFEVIFIFVALFILIFFLVFSGDISRRWLEYRIINANTVDSCLLLMGAIVSLRWTGLVSRSGIDAYEEQKWLSIFDVLVNTVRHPGALFFVIFFSGGVISYFSFILFVTSIETILLRRKFHSLLPEGGVRLNKFSTEALRRASGFALGIGYAALMWALMTQLDRLLLSRKLGLDEYGYFSIVVLIATGVMALVTPVGRALLPRMTAQLSLGDSTEMIKVYRHGVRLVASLVVPIATVFALYPYQIIFAWTGNEIAAEWGRSVLPPFIAGSGLLAIISFQYYLQYAHGVMRYHVIYTTVFTLCSIPVIIFSVDYYGAVGAAWTWFGGRAISMIFWVPFIHNKLVPGLHRRWLFLDVVPVVAVAVGAVLFLGWILPVDVEGGRFATATWLVFLCVTSVVLSFLLGAREAILAWLRRVPGN